ncbi:hypothetical protein [Bradyrhizobium sp. CCBAU 53415]|uniref:hypothetical protein n=1 Tax=Bradyrhizobium sp. CCBAU 53415 TaxID=1325119 RepID=UPI0023053202|nr:hypothetical protein [Bradyrhizobium sp. CCBAU 53415]MDA9467030.1 hypothetical protein [Bradyrhizobium sp. CCBAU 53415]
MKIDRAQYEAWRQQCSDIYSIVTDKNDDWVGAVSSLMLQIERDCPDTNVTSNARTARRHALAFKSPKRKVRLADIYLDFLKAWQRVELAIGMHLIDKPPIH